jgi:hypothetical protein
MDFGDLLQGAGLLICVGAILLAVLVFVGIRRAFAARPPNQIEGEAGVTRDRMYNQPYETQRATENPRYDSDRVESSGGFGSPQPSSRSGARTYDNSRRDIDDRLDPDFDRELPRRSNRDDDDVRSSGGFGG